MLIQDSIPTLNKEPWVGALKIEGNTDNGHNESIDSGDELNKLLSTVDSGFVGLAATAFHDWLALALGDKVYRLDMSRPDIDLEYRLQNYGLEAVVWDEGEFYLRSNRVLPVKSITIANNILARKAPRPHITKLVSEYGEVANLLDEHGNLDWFDKLCKVMTILGRPRTLATDKVLLGLLRQEAQTGDEASSLAQERLDRIAKFEGEFLVGMTANKLQTGRFGCLPTDLYNLRADLRQYIKVGGCSLQQYGDHFLTADYKQLHPRIFAALSKDDVLGRSFRDGSDLYRENAAVLFGKDEQEITEKERKVAKQFTLGFINGMGASQVLEQLKEAGITDVSAEEAEKFTDCLKNRYQKLFAWRSSIGESGLFTPSASGAEYGILRTPSGRQVLYPEDGALHKKPHKLPAHLAQAIEVEIIVDAVLRFDDLCKKKGMTSTEAAVFLTFHDELVVTTISNRAEKVAKLLKQAMTEAFNEYPGMPTYQNLVDISGPRPHWGEPM